MMTWALPGRLPSCSLVLPGQQMPLQALQQRSKQQVGAPTLQM